MNIKFSQFLVVLHDFPVRSLMTRILHNCRKLASSQRSSLNICSFNPPLIYCTVLQLLNVTDFSLMQLYSQTSEMCVTFHETYHNLPNSAVIQLRITSLFSVFCLGVSISSKPGVTTL
jgi:hypothetical protein